MTTVQRSRVRQPAGILRPSPRPVRTVSVAVVAAVVVLLLGVALRHSTLDRPVVAGFNALHVGAIAAFTNGVYLFFSPVPAVVITVVIVAAIWTRTRSIRVAAAFAGTVAVTWLPTAVLKAVLHRDRPAGLANPFSPAQVDGSFPSGHAAFVAALLVAFVVLARETAVQGPVAAIGFIAMLVVDCALLVDGVHFPTDVLASIVWSLGIGPLVLLAWNRWVTPRLPAGR